MFLSVIVPVHNEYDSLLELDFRLHQSLKSLAEGFEYQILYIDDGSTDNSNLLLKKLSRNVRTELLTLRANFGKSMALLAGFKYAKGDFIATIDSDLQDYQRTFP